jgi:hypothetical protein
MQKWIFAMSVVFSTQLGASVVAKKPYSPISDMRAGNNLEQWLVRPAPAYKFKNKGELHRFITLVAKKQGLPADLLKRIVAVESSNCRSRVNTLTQDFGCMQLNATTIKLYKWNRDSVIKNDFINVYAASIILKDFKKNSPADYACRYNIGYRHLPRTCAAYIAKLASITL